MKNRSCMLKAEASAFSLRALKGKSCRLIQKAEQVSGVFLRQLPANVMKKELSAAGVVEMVLIIAVLISLVVLFKTQITGLLGTIFGQIEEAAQGVF